MSSKLGRMYGGCLRWSALAGVASMVALVLFAHSGHAIVNPTHSICPGLYFSRPPGALRHGMVVTFCPDEVQHAGEIVRRGYLPKGPCPSGSAMIMKRVAGLPGDHYSVTDDGVFVNGVAISATRPMGEDPKGRKMPYFRVRDRIVGTDEVLVTTDGSSMYSRYAYDSRYYGAIKRSQIVERAWLVMPWLGFGRIM